MTLFIWAGDHNTGLDKISMEEESEVKKDKIQTAGI